MSVYQKLADAQLDARKTKNSERLAILQVVISEVKNEGIAKQVDLADADVEKVIARLVKQLKDARSEFASAGREELVAKNDAEISVLEEFLPEQMSADELEKIVVKVIEEVKPTGPSDMGAVMGAVMPHVQGRADGNQVREIVMRLIQ